MAEKTAIKEDAVCDKYMGQLEDLPVTEIGKTLCDLAASQNGLIVKDALTVDRLLFVHMTAYMLPK